MQPIVATLCLLNFKLQLLSFLVIELLCLSTTPPPHCLETLPLIEWYRMIRYSTMIIIVQNDTVCCSNALTILP